jgi:4-hydroxybenzoate polyprenyltransferase
VSARDWLALARVSNLPTVWMNVLAAAVLATGRLPLGPYLLLVAALSAFYAAGMVWNDVVDRELDAAAKPGRPIPSGRITVQAARVFGSALFALGLGLLLAAPHTSAVLPGLALVALIAVYDRYHKAHPLTVLAMAGCRVGVFVVSAWALTGGVQGAVWIGAAASFVHTALVTVVARVENARGNPFPFPAVPAFIAAMGITDGVVLALLRDPAWILAGAAAAAAAWAGQRFVRGD